MSDEVKVSCGNCGLEWRQTNRPPYECPKCGSRNTCSDGARAWRRRRVKIDGGR